MVASQRQKRQREHHPSRVPAGMIEVAHVGRLDGAELDGVEVLLVLGEHLTVADLDGELAAGPLFEDRGDPFDTFGVGAPFTPVGMPPLDRRAVDSLGARRRWGKHQYGAQRAYLEVFHSSSSLGPYEP
jgi:hypothetical protein